MMMTMMTSGKIVTADHSGHTHTFQGIVDVLGAIEFAKSLRHISRGGFRDEIGQETKFGVDCDNGRTPEDFISDVTNPWHKGGGVSVDGVKRSGGFACKVDYVIEGGNGFYELIKLDISELKGAKNWINGERNARLSKCQDKTVSKLKEMCRKKRVDGFSKLKKADMVRECCVEPIDDTALYEIRKHERDPYPDWILSKKPLYELVDDWGYDASDYFTTPKFGDAAKKFMDDVGK